MVDLSVNFASLELKNPLAVAASDNSRDIRQVKQAEECGASAVILKAMFPSGVKGLESKPRFFIDRKAGALYGIAGTKRLSYEEAMELVKVAKKETKVKIGVNLPFYKLEDREVYADAARRAEEAGADFVEINFSPQIPEHLQTMSDPKTWKAEPEKALKTAVEITRDLPRWGVEGTKIIKQALKNIPVLTKIEPEGIEAVTMAMAMENGGADAIDAINAPNGSFRIDILNRGRLAMPATKNSTFAYSGAPLKPVAQAIVARVSKAVKIPIMGTGGLMNWRDVVEMIMFGATTVSFCTLLMIHGFAALTKIEKGLRGFMEQQGYSRVEDFRGLALKYVSQSEPACERIPSVAKIDEEKCTGCGICTKPAHCLAISMVNGKAVVNEKECLGCGTCFLFCPEGAVSMVEI